MNDLDRQIATKLQEVKDDRQTAVDIILRADNTSAALHAIQMLAPIFKKLEAMSAVVKEFDRLAPVLRQFNPYIQK